MALAHGAFFIQDRLRTKQAHHESFEKLWELKWKEPCSMGIYPFEFGAEKDFEQPVKTAIEKGLKEPYDWDEYAECFIPKGEELVAQAQEAEKVGNKDKASELYLRAGAVYRTARFPLPRSERQRHAWVAGKTANLHGMQLKMPRTREVEIPHKYAIEGDGKHLPVYYHLPEGASKDHPVPLVILMGGIDGYRTELSIQIPGWAEKNVAAMTVDIPGTGDSPADRNDPKSPDRLWSTMFDWIDEQPEIDHKKVAMWSVSTGGYYAVRLAHTHHDRLAGVAAHGGGTHWTFDPAWLSVCDHLEFPFDFATTLAYKFGYGNDLDAFKKDAMKYSLVEDGTLDGEKVTELLLINGEGDELFPIDDYWVCLERGAPKQARFVKNAMHMGEPEASPIVIAWLYKILGIKGDAADAAKQLGTHILEIKY